MPNIPSSQIHRDIETIIRRIRPDLDGEIRLTDRLRDDIGLDSLHSMELLSEVTEKYELDVDPEELQDVRTVGDVVAFLATLMNPEN
jgi:acyl carrier protein